MRAANPWWPRQAGGRASPVFVGISAFLLWAGTTQAEPMFDTNALHHLDQALRCLAIDRSELQFRKDVAEPLSTVPRVRESLRDPLSIPVFGDEVLAAADASRYWTLARGLLSDGIEQPRSGPAPNCPTDFPASVAAALARAWPDLCDATYYSAQAFAGVTATDQQYAAAVHLGGIFDSEGVAAVRDHLRDLGVGDAALAAAIADEIAIDPRPMAEKLIATLDGLAQVELFLAAAALERALSSLAAAIDRDAAWPVAVQRIETPLGTVVIGTRGSDLHAAPAFLTIDPGGEDRYLDPVTTANGLKGRRVSALLDLGGDDVYEGRGLLGPAAACFGVVAVRDEAGDDRYNAHYAGCASATFGAALLHDLTGNDVYTGQAHCHGAATAGAAVLRDDRGTDVYDAGFNAEGFAGFYGLGLLVDRAGTDRYLAGGIRGDYGRRADHFLTLSQGFSIGMRPFLGGGLGALVDLEGNDTYKADMFGQGASYWYATGMLLDRAGHDSYTAYQYAQGSGIHLATALLWDGGGNDRYTGWDICQGSSHDFAASFMLDDGGNDTYTANDSSQGMALHNALGILLDRAGRDAYFGRRGRTCQGAGHTGGRREYGSLGLLLDLAGQDRYTSGAGDGARMLRPSYGIVYDVEDQP